MNSNERAIFQHHLYLLENKKKKKLQEFHARVKQNPTVLSPLFKHIQSTCEDLQNCTFKILFHPIKEQLNQVSSQTMLEQVWTSSSAGAGTREPDMPDFSFSPQEYITQIGQYLMTMPQHLEPYMTNDNPALSRALQVILFFYFLISFFLNFSFSRRESFLFAAAFHLAQKNLNQVTPLQIFC